MGPRAVPVFAAIGVALLALAGLVLALLSEQREAARWVAHTLRVKTEIEATVRLLVDAETGQRGYLLTQQDEFLEPYQHARAVIPDHLQELRSLTIDNLAQQERFDRLEPLVETRLGQFAWTIDSTRGGHTAEAVAWVRTGEGKHTMDAIRGVLREVREEEDGLLRERQDALAAERTACLQRFAGGLLLSATLVGGSVSWLVGSARQLAVREQEFRGIVLAASEGIWLLDPDGRIVLANPAMAQLLGYEPEELVGRVYWQEFCFPEDRTFLESLFERRRQGVSEDVDVRFRHRLGGEVWTLLSARSLRGPGGRYEGALDFFTDITERRRAEARTRFLAELGVRLLGRPSPAAVFSTTADALLPFLGIGHCSFEELDIASGSLRVVHQVGVPTVDPEWAISALGPAAESLLAGQPVVVDRTDSPPPALAGARAFVLVPRARTGETVTTMCVASEKPRPWPAGEVELLSAVVHRAWLAAEWASAQDRVRRNDALVRAVAEAVPDAVFAIDREHRCILANPAALVVIGRPEEVVLGSTVRDWGFSDTQADLLWRSDERVMREGQPARMDESVGDRVYQVVKVPLRGADGAVVGLVGVSRDVTGERAYARMLERTVAERTEALSASVASLEQLLYSIAHDLRAPNRAVHGFAELLELEGASCLDARSRLYLSRIKTAAASSDGLIRDLLRYGQLAHTDVPVETVELEAVVRAAILDQDALVREKHADVKVRPPLPGVCANFLLLKQLLANLIGNALTYVAPGKTPEVEVSAVQVTEGVEIRVDDRGVGIDPAHAERVFEPFARLAGTTAPGTGIGLAIVRRATERMRGRVGVLPRPGGGSRFWVRLPPPCDGPLSLQAIREKA